VTLVETCCLELAGTGDTRLTLGLASRGTDSLNALHRSVRFLVARNDLAEDDVLAIEPTSNDGGDEELGSIGVGAGIGHGEHVWLLVLQLEVLIGKLLSKDGTSTRAVMTSEVASLEHELRNDTVESAASIASDFVALGKLTEVFGGLGNDVVEELELDASSALSSGSVLLDDVSALVGLMKRTVPGNVKVDS